VNLAVISLAIFVGLSYGTTWVAVLISAMSLPVLFYAFELVASVLECRPRSSSALVHPPL